MIEGGAGVVEGADGNQAVEIDAAFGEREEVPAAVGFEEAGVGELRRGHPHLGLDVGNIIWGRSRNKHGPSVY